MSAMAPESAHRGRVLVLGREERAFLSVIRSLGRSGLEVHAGMCEPDDLAVSSRYVHRYHDIPPFQPGETNWIDCLEQILGDEPFQLIVPCNDHVAIPVHLHRARLQPLTRVAVPEDEAFRIAFSKIESHRLATDLGVPVARGCVVSPETPTGEILNALTLPVVLKPPSSFTPEALTAKRAVLRARTDEDLTRGLRAAASWNEVLVEENFIGTGVGVELLAQAGNVLFAFQHVRVHEPLEGGGSSYRRSVALHPELLAASSALMRALNYTGVAMVEFKLNFETGRWIFIEINGRFWGSLPLAIAAGADFPRYLYEMLVHGRDSFPQAYRVGLYCRNIRTDLQWLQANLTSDRRDPTLATRPLPSVAREIVNVLLLRERWDTLVLDDPMPGLVELARVMGAKTGALARILRRRAGRGPVARWRAQRRVAAALPTARRLLFVCKGNICRSPFAEQYAKLRLPLELLVASTGYYPRADREPPAEAIAAARRQGVDLARHRSSVLTPDDISRADLIMVFDDENYDEVLRRFPAARKRIVRLGALLDDGAAIADPYGKDGSAFDAVYTRIARVIERLSALRPRATDSVPRPAPDRPLPARIQDRPGH